MILNTINIPALQGMANKHVVEKGWRERDGWRDEMVTGREEAL
jgi:hypothetical protein